MTGGTSTARSVLLLLLLLLCLLGQRRSGAFRLSGLRQTITRNATAVELSDGRLMEIVEERTCSAALVRLTCRSLSAFVYVLEANYQPNRSDACVWERRGWCRHRALIATIRNLQARRDFLAGRYGLQMDDENYDFRRTLNRRCSGHHHCRYRVTSDHPEALFWRPANIRIKYACIPEASVYKYCNAELEVTSGAGGFLRSPGYPLYYLGGFTCGWTFRSAPGQRILLTFHDLSLRDHEPDGSCVDVVRVRDDGNTLLETCGSAAGLRLISNSNVITLNLIASARFYPARGFLLQYQVLGCPEVTAPPGSYISNGNLESRTFLCRDGGLFPDTRQRTRTIRCKHGHWLESPKDLPACVAAASSSSAVSNGTDLLAGLRDTSRYGLGAEDVILRANNRSIMDQAQPTAIKDGDFVIDIILPTILIALLFAGNAVIVYIIFQYRKRKMPAAEQHSRIEESLSITHNCNDSRV